MGCRCLADLHFTRSIWTISASYASARCAVLEDSHRRRRDAKRVDPCRVRHWFRGTPTRRMGAARIVGEQRARTVMRASSSDRDPRTRSARVKSSAPRATSPRIDMEHRSSATRSGARGPPSKRKAASPSTTSASFPFRVAEADRAGAMPPPHRPRRSDGPQLRRGSAVARSTSPRRRCASAKRRVRARVLVSARGRDTSSASVGLLRHSTPPRSRGTRLGVDGALARDTGGGIGRRRSISRRGSSSPARSTPGASVSKVAPCSSTTSLPSCVQSHATSLHGHRVPSSRTSTTSRASESANVERRSPYDGCHLSPRPPPRELARLDEGGELDIARLDEAQHSARQCLEIRSIQKNSKATDGSIAKRDRGVDPATSVRPVSTSLAVPSRCARGPPSLRPEPGRCRRVRPTIERRPRRTWPRAQPRRRAATSPFHWAGRRASSVARHTRATCRSSTSHGAVAIVRRATSSFANARAQSAQCSRCSTSDGSPRPSAGSASQRVRTLQVMGVPPIPVVRAAPGGRDARGEAESKPSLL